jgi:hypothetical protein
VNQLMFLPRSGSMILAVYFSARLASHQRLSVASATGELNGSGSIVEGRDEAARRRLFPGFQKPGSIHSPLCGGSRHRPQFTYVFDALNSGLTLSV